MTRKNIFVTCAIVLALWVSWFALQPRPTYSETQVVFKKNGDIIQVQVPKNDAAYVLGLGGKTVLPEDYGMLWSYTPPTRPEFTMRGMRIPLDFIWFKDNKVTQIRANVDPSVQSILPGVDITEVLEVNAGYAERHNVQIGDKVEILPWYE